MGIEGDLTLYFVWFAAEEVVIGDRGGCGLDRVDYPPPRFEIENMLIYMI